MSAEASNSDRTNERTPDDIERDVRERDPLTGPAQLAQALTEEVDEPRTNNGNPRDGIEEWARAAIEVSADASPGADDDYLYQTFGVLASDVDISKPEHITIRTDQDRFFRVRVVVDEISAEEAVADRSRA